MARKKKVVEDTLLEVGVTAEQNKTAVNEATELAIENAVKNEEQDKLLKKKEALDKKQSKLIAKNGERYEEQLLQIKKLEGKVLRNFVLNIVALALGFAALLLAL